MSATYVFEDEFDGIPLTIEVGKWAQQANGSCLVRYGDTVVLSTVVMSDRPSMASFLPLQVQVEERFYAVGRIPGGYRKREGKPELEATLLARQIDRSIRPRFPQSLRHNIQVTNTILAYDHQISLFLPTLLGTSVALGLSDIPFSGAVAGYELDLSTDGWISDCLDEEISSGHMTLAGDGTTFTMIEGSAKQCSEDELLDGLVKAQTKLFKLVKLQEVLCRSYGKAKKEIGAMHSHCDVIYFDDNKIRQILMLPLYQQRQKALVALKSEMCAQILEGDDQLSLDEIEADFDQMVLDQMRDLTLRCGWRFDGRRPDEVRPLKAEIDSLPSVHGSAVFTRGETQVLSVLTLAGPDEAQNIDDIRGERKKRFSLHYNFPSYAVGEISRFGAPNRRELGHGSLGERALSAVLPDYQQFPYTIRLVSEVLSSNGSSSQASICAGSLALMAGGVPIRASVAGVAMGLVSDDHNFQILTDLSSEEDHYGDMDFKIAGTKQGITAFQMDTKTSGLPINVLKKALLASQPARNSILDCMAGVLASPRQSVGDNVPKICGIKIPIEKIKKVIGRAGSRIDQIIAQTHVTIDIAEDGQALIYAECMSDAQKAHDMIAEIIQEPIIGEIYTDVEVTKLMKYGAFVHLFGDEHAFVHISQIAWERTEKVEDVLSVGDRITVQLIDRDDKGRLNASIKSLLPRPKNMRRKEE